MKIPRSSLVIISLFSVLFSCEQDNGASSDNDSKSGKSNPTSGSYSSKQPSQRSDTLDLAQMHEAGYAGIHPADAKRLLQQLGDSDASVEQRIQSSGMIISALVKQGKTDAALELIQPTYGAVRDEQVRSFFGGLMDMETIQMHFHSLKNDHDRLQALRGMIGGFGIPGLAKLGNVGIEWNRSNRDLVAGSIAEALTVSNDGQSGQVPNEQAALAVEQIVALHALEILDVDALQIILDANQQLKAGEVIQLLDQMNAVRASELLNPVYQNVMRGFATSDPEGAMALALSRKDRAGLMSGLVQGYYLHDASRAAQWFTTHVPKMTDSQHDAGVKVIANQAILQGDFATAAKWISQLRFEKLRVEMERKLANVRQKNGSN